MRRPVSTPRCLKAVEVAVPSRVVGRPDPASSARAPAARRAPGCGSRAGGPGPWLAPPVDLCAHGCQWRVESARVATATAQALVAGPPEGGDPQLARLQGDRAHAGVGGHRRLGRVAPAGIAELGDQGRRADRRLGVAEQRPEDRRVGMGGEALADLRGRAPRSRRRSAPARRPGRATTARTRLDLDLARGPLRARPSSAPPARRDRSCRYSRCAPGRPAMRPAPSPLASAGLG